MKVQVSLDRLGFSPGIIDGKSGDSLQLALKGFQEARGLRPSGRLDTPTRAALAKLEPISATRMVRIPPAFAHQTYYPTLPRDAEGQASFARLGYRNMMEALAERFHTTPDVLVALNSGETLIGANRIIRVPNTAEFNEEQLANDVRGWGATLATLGVATNQPRAARITVDKSEGVLKVFDKENQLIAAFPATMGSSRDPLPLGRWKTVGVSKNPDFHYNPKLFWDVSDQKSDQLLKPGPNGPVGVVWIDLSKPHYGIHGTSEPQTIGRAESHGCVRLTNWDAARLAQMVKESIAVVFQA